MLIWVDTLFIIAALADRKFFIFAKITETLKYDLIMTIF